MSTLLPLGKSGARVALREGDLLLRPRLPEERGRG